MSAPTRQPPPPYHTREYYPGNNQPQYAQQPGYNNAGYQGDPTKQPVYSQDRSYGSYAHTTIIQQQTVPVVVVGGCPACRVGVLEDDFTCLGVCCAIFFFPLGILCCLAMKQRRCPNCGAIFG